MKLLFFGSHKDRFSQFSSLMKRSGLEMSQVTVPESGLFTILHEPVAAAFIDMLDPGIDGPELLGDIRTLNAQLDVVLLVTPEVAEAMPLEQLRGCFGVVDPPIVSHRNHLLVSQLTEHVNLKQRIKELESASNLDGLTKLFNHAYVQNYIHEEVVLALERGDLLSLVFLDVDHFKVYNDTNGHPEGDRVLRTFAAIMRRTVRKFDLLARYGGEEFVIVLPSTSLKSALRVAERCRQNILSTKFEFGNRQPLGFVSASFGVCGLERGETDTRASLLHHADQALYRAKDHGRNCIWYYHAGVYHGYRAPQGRIID